MGLGNPGAQYAGTRHNFGCHFVEKLAQQHGCSLATEKRFAGQIGKFYTGEQTIWLLLPDTYMNLSGDSIGNFIRFHKIRPQAMLVAHDDLDLPPGVTRLKINGGNGGHNGLKDISQKIGSSEYVRLRIGIGRPPKDRGADYVLKKPPREEGAAIEEAIDTALALMPDVIAGNLHQAMQTLHTEFKSKE